MAMASTDISAVSAARRSSPPHPSAGGAGGHAEPAMSASSSRVRAANSRPRSGRSWTEAATTRAAPAPSEYRTPVAVPRRRRLAPQRSARALMATRA